MKDELIYIAGSGHSGSTLLNMLLDSHEEISGLGEIHRFSLAIKNDIKPLLCSCGKTVLVCPFWVEIIDTLLDDYSISRGELNDFRTTTADFMPRDVDSQYLNKSNNEKLYPISLNRIAMVIGSFWLWNMVKRISPEVNANYAAIQNSLHLFDAVRKAKGTPIIVDSTKNPTRLKGLFLLKDGNLFIIHLIRDGRAVCYSRMRREAVSMEESAKIWLAEQRKLHLVMHDIPESAIYKIHYEELAANPEEVLEKICEKLKIPYQPEMVNFRSRSGHILGGNPMRFQSEETDIRIDLEWKDKLTSVDLAIFEDIAGNINRKYGYH